MAPSVLNVSWSLAKSYCWRTPQNSNEDNDVYSKEPSLDPTSPTLRGHKDAMAVILYSVVWVVQNFMFRPLRW